MMSVRSWKQLPPLSCLRADLFKLNPTSFSPSDDEAELTSFPASLTMLDAFASEWATIEKTGSTILSIDEISSLLFGGGSETRHRFGLIILRLSVSDDVPVEIVSVLQKFFRDLLEDATFAIRVSIAKLFLQILPVMDTQLCKLLLPTKIGNRIRY
jgi:hypothetical protein